MALEVFRQLKQADARLQRTFGGPPVELAAERRRLRLNLLRQHLDRGLDSLRARHARGASGRESVQAQAGFMDRFLSQLFALASEDARREGQEPFTLVLVALGGYGRGELHPSSDIDVMVIYEGELSPYVQRVTQELLYTLWDLGLQVGHSCRSLPDCLAMARTDFPSRTSMQEARYVAGDRALFRRFGKVLRENLYRKDFAGFLETALAERDQRYRKFGGSPYLGEPNIKESAGGLRDIHTAMWLASAKFGARTLRELADKGLITDREQRTADGALTFLWRVRNELHFLSGHKNDVLSHALQPEIARNLGYADQGGMLGVERFMREYYLHARVIHRVARRLIARCQETLSRRVSAQRGLRQQALADGLFFDGRLHAAEPGDRIFREDPTRLMKVFWHAHRLGSELSIDLERAVEESLDLIDERFRRAAEARDLLLAICRNWGRVAATLREMHELGVLGRYLPEWGALTCLVQYDAYHKFSADQHSLLAVETLESLAPGQSAESEGIARVLTEVEKPELLLLGMLLHDIGKAGGGHGHVARGIPLIQALAARIGFAPRDAAALVFLVEHHLLMSHVAQRRDIDDPKTIERFADAVHDPQWLRMLYLLTYADMKAVGPGILTSWRAAILWELYSRTLVRLTGGRLEPPRREAVAVRVLMELGGEETWEEVEAHLERMAERYLVTTGAQRMAAHLRLIERLKAEPVATELFHHPDLGFSDLVVVTRDLPGLFSLIAGTLAANGVNILSAQIHTRGDGIALDTFQVNDPIGEAITEEPRWARTLENLSAVIRGEQTVEGLLARRQARREAPPVPGPAKVALDNQLSDTHTVVEVKCPDRVGLLYLITRTLSREGLDIGSARIATEIDQAFDAFYVTDRDGRKIEDPDAMDRIRQALEDALVSPL